MWRESIMSSTLSVRKVVVVTFAMTMIVALTSVAQVQAREGKGEVSSSQTSQEVSGRRMPAAVYHVPTRLIKSLKGRCAAKYAGRKERLCKNAQDARAQMATMVVTRMRAKHFYHAYKHDYHLALWCENNGTKCDRKYKSAKRGCGAEWANYLRIACWRQKGTLQFYKYNLIGDYADAPIPGGVVGVLLRALNKFKTPQFDNSTHQVSTHWAWFGGEYIQVLFSRSETRAFYKRVYFADSVQAAAAVVCIAAGIPWVIAACEVLVGVTIADVRHDLKEASSAGKCLQLKVFTMPNLGPSPNVFGIIRSLNPTSVAPCQ